MLRKSEMTIDKFYELGAYFLIAKTVLPKLSTQTARILGVKYSDKITNAYRIVQNISFCGEEKMFELFKYLPNDYLSVFSMNLKSEPHNEVREIMVSKAREILDDMVYKQKAIDEEA